MNIDGNHFLPRYFSKRAKRKVGRQAYKVLFTFREREPHNDHGGRNSRLKQKAQREGGPVDYRLLLRYVEDITYVFAAQCTSAQRMHLQQE